MQSEEALQSCTSTNQTTQSTSVFALGILSLVQRLDGLHQSIIFNDPSLHAFNVRPDQRMLYQSENLQAVDGCN